jgi:hypothetical protein
VLAKHMVRGWQQLAPRRAAKHPALLSARDVKGLVGVAGAESLDLQRGIGAGNLLAQEPGEAADIEQPGKAVLVHCYRIRAARRVKWPGAGSRVLQEIGGGLQVMHTLVWGIATILISVGVAIGGFLIVDRFVPVERRREHNDVAGFLYAFVGPLYAILLAFVVFVVWGDLSAARSAAADEAGHLYTLFSISEGLGGPQGYAIQQASLEYGESVINDEWPALARGQESPRTSAVLRALRARVLAVSPSSDRESDLYSAAVGTVDAVSIARNLRAIKGEETIPPVLWSGLLVGAVGAIAYSYLFGMEGKVAHVLMIGVLTLFVVGMLYIIQVLNGPFQGDVSIRPDAMQLSVSKMQDVLNQP